MNVNEIVLYGGRPEDISHRQEKEMRVYDMLDSLGKNIRGQISRSGWMTCLINFFRLCIMRLYM